MNVSRSLTHAMVADCDGELLRLLLEVQRDREVLAKLIDQGALLLALVVVKTFDRIELGEAEVPQHRISWAGRHRGSRVHQEFPKPSELDEGFHPVDQTFGQRVHWLA